MSQTLVPLHDRVVILPEDGPDQTPGGIFLPEMAKEKPQRGIVNAVGPGRYENGIRIAPSVEEGDRVLYARYSGTEIKVDGVKLLLIKESEILAIIRGDGD